MINNKAYVKEIKWWSKDRYTADVLVTDGTFECWAYSSPCDLKPGVTLTYPLTALMAENIMISDTNNYFLTSLSTSNIIGVGKLVDYNNAILKIGSMYIHLDGYLPGDCKVGDFISFECERIDIDE